MEKKKKLIKIKDMPKLESPFVRVGKNHTVTPKINPGYEWVFEDESVIAQEKLDGTNVSIIIKNSKIIRVFNRLNEVELDIWSRNSIIESVKNSYHKGYCNLPDGQHFGETVGIGINGNPYELDTQLWLPFNTYCANYLTYKSWGKYPKDFDTISSWFQNDLLPLFYMKRHYGNREGFVEGVVFHHPDGRMAKLRVDMFDWFQGEKHKGKNHEQA